MIRADLGLANTGLTELPAQNEVGRHSLPVSVFEVFRCHDAIRIDRISSRKRNSILKAGLWDVRVQDSEILDDLRIWVGKNRNVYAEAASKILDDLRTV